MGNITEDWIRQRVGDTDRKTALIEKRPFFLSGTSIVPDAQAPQAEAESPDNEWMAEVPVVYNMEDPTAPRGEDGSITTKRIAGVESTGKRPREKTGNADDTPSQEESEPEETMEEKVNRLEAELAQRNTAPVQAEQEQEQMETEEEETENMDQEKVRVFMSAGGFDIRSDFRDVQYNAKEAYIVLVYHPDDEVALPRKGNDVEITTDDIESKVFRLSKYYLRITGTSLIACVLDEVTELNGERIDE